MSSEDINIGDVVYDIKSKRPIIVDDLFDVGFNETYLYNKHNNLTIHISNVTKYEKSIHSNFMFKYWN